MSDIHDILSSYKGDQLPKLTEEKLQAYLEGKLSAEEQHAVEILLSEEGMESDAVEGLTTMSIKESTASVNKLNRRLQQQLATKKRKRNGFYRDNKWNVLSVFVLLLLIVLAYLVLHFLLKK